MFKVTWDNGASACGTFPDTFDTWEKADEYGSDWAYERNIETFGHPDVDDGYTYEVVEVK